MVPVRRHSPASTDAEATTIINPLTQAIEAAYTTFARYRLHGPIIGCPCCIGTVPRERLHATPLHLLTANDLGRYAAKALTTIGTVHDFKHFLPRILELTAEDSTWSLGPEVILGKLLLAEWLSWPAEEVHAVRAFLCTWWQQRLSTLPDASPLMESAEDYLCAIAQAEDDLTPYLAEWRARRDLPAVLHLAAVITSNPPRSLGTAFWPPRAAQHGQVVAWLAAPETAVQLESAFFVYSTDPAAEDLSLALDRWRAWQPASTRP